MSEPARYKIEKVEDLLAVPDDKLEACLIDLAIYVRLMKVSKPLIDSGLITVRPGLVWMDDGEHTARINVEVTR